MLVEDNEEDFWRHPPQNDIEQLAHSYCFGFSRSAVVVVVVVGERRRRKSLEKVLGFLPCCGYLTFWRVAQRVCCHLRPSRGHFFFSLFFSLLLLSVSLADNKTGAVIIIESKGMYPFLSILVCWLLAICFYRIKEKIFFCYSIHRSPEIRPFTSQFRDASVRLCSAGSGQRQ